MKLIVGLGNPGSEYFNTRHNFGFLVLNYFQDSAGGFSNWQKNEKFKALLSEGQLNVPPSPGGFGEAKEKIILVKPQTFMNNSGQAVKLLADFYKISSPDIWVLHDDLDLPLGEIRLSQNASAGGHKGVDSIIKSLGTQDFLRLRLGIKPEDNFISAIFHRFTPARAKLGFAEKFVLQKFSATEKVKVQSATQKAYQAILLALKKSVAKTQTQFN